MSQPSRFDAFATLSVFDVADAVWQKRRSVIVVFLGLAIVFGMGLGTLPNRYISKAQLLVRLGPGSVSMDPTTNLSQTVSLQESRLTQVNSIVELLRSKEMTMRVVEQVGPDRLLETSGPFGHLSNLTGRFLPESKPQPEAGFTATEIDEMMRVANACIVVENDAEIFQAKDAYTISIEFVGNSPFLARDVVDAYVKEYPKYHTAAHEAAGSVEFFESEAALAYEKATRLQDEVRNLKTKHGIIDLDSSKSALRDELNSVQRDQNQVESELSSVRAELAKLDTDIKSMPLTVESEKITGLYKNSGDLVRQRLYDLEIEAQALASKYKPDHPKRVALDAQLKAAKETATSEIGQEPQLRETINPNLQKLDLSYRTAVAQQAGLEAKGDALAKQYERIQGQLSELNQTGSELVKLTWDASVAESTYLQTSERLANARQVQSLNELRVSDVSVAQNATLELKKVGPKRTMMMIVAMALAAITALSQAALRGLIPMLRSGGRLESRLAWTSPAGHLSRREMSDNDTGDREDNAATVQTESENGRSTGVSIDAAGFFASRKSEAESSSPPSTRPR